MTLRPHQRAWWLLTGVLLLAFFLRVHDLDRSPLRGDEAFAVRYWAAPPSEVLARLAWVEPHPFGTFFGFYAWKTLVGEGEFVMRMLPALVNLLGAAGMWALARRLRLGGAAALLAALVWAVNPGLIWHSQDVRNYALWAGLSVIALWLLLRAAQTDRPRDWALYAAVEIAALYLFFLEAFLLALHGLIVLGWRAAAQPRRHTPKRALTTAALIGIALIPWLYQAVRLAGSGYGGTAERASLPALLGFGAEWLVGQPDLAFAPNTPLAWLPLPLLWAGAALWLWRSRSSAAALSLLLLTALPALLALAATRLDVFRARYLIAIMPAVVLVLVSPFSGQRLRLTPMRLVSGGLAALAVGLGILTLAGYYAGQYPKAPDWRALSAALNARAPAWLWVEPADADGTLDPALGYYYEGRFDALPPAADRARLLAETAVITLLSPPDAPTPPGFEAAARLNETRLTDFVIADYIANDRPLPPIAPHIRAGGGSLDAWDVVGTVGSGTPFSVLLGWSPPPDAEWKVFLHLVNAEGEIMAQADRFPTASGLDIYPFSPAVLPAGDYTLRFGLYREADGQRAPLADASGTALGDVVALGVLTVPHRP